MAHVPKLEVYVIYLQPSQGSTKKTFKDFLDNNFTTDSENNTTKKYEAFFEDFISSINNSYYINKKRKKALSLQEKESGESPDATISYKKINKIIEGRIKGGRFGQKRSLGDMEKPDNAHAIISDKKIVLDDFYFLLSTPIGSSKSVLLLQSYSDDNINDIFLRFIGEKLRGNGFLKPAISQYCPQSIKDEFKKNSFVKQVIFRQDLLISDIDDKTTIATKDVTVEITITAKKEGESVTKFRKLHELLGTFSLAAGTKKKLQLSNFPTQVGRLVKNGHQSSFNLETNNIEIKPIIYLEDHIALQEDGTPNWNSLKKYSAELLEEIKIEVYPEHEVSKS